MRVCVPLHTLWRLNCDDRLGFVGHIERERNSRDSSALCDSGWFVRYARHARPECGHTLISGILPSDTGSEVSSSLHVAAERTPKRTTMFGALGALLTASVV